jgi:ubiquinone biosynthesis protein UbiJ
MVIDYLPANGGVEGKIRVGVNFVRVLRSFGADSSNALAFVLGHEMGPYIS